jgi:hypothetical protein
MGDYNILDGVLTVPTKGGELRIKRQIPPAVKAAFEDWLELTARRRVYHLRKELGETEYVANMEFVQTCSAAGKYRWGGEAMRSALGDLPGAVQLIVLLCHEAGQRDVTPSQVLRIMADESDRAILLNALKEVTTSSANFMEPPEMEIARTT